MPKGRYWTTLEDEVLVAYANRGADYVRKMLKEELGRDRSRSSIISRAHVIRVSLGKYDICPECNRPVKYRSLSEATGMCRVCNERYLADASRKRREAAERPYTAEEEALIERYRKQRTMERKRKQRALDKQKDLLKAQAKYPNL